MTRVVWCLARRDFFGVRTILIITSFELLCLMAYSYPRVIRNLSCTGGVNVKCYKRCNTNSYWAFDQTLYFLRVWRARLPTLGNAVPVATTAYKRRLAYLGKAYKILGLIRRTFSTNLVPVKKKLYISLIRSQLLYCSQVWRPFLIKHILLLEQAQRRATKYILNDYCSSYKSRLLNLKLLPLMYIYELNDVIFLLNLTNPHLNILISMII